MESLVRDVAEDRLALGGPPVTRTFGEGEAFNFSAEGGELRRHSFSYAEELRPLGT